MLQDGFGLKDLTLKKLEVDKKGEYDVEGETNVQDIHLLNGALTLLTSIYLVGFPKKTAGRSMEAPCYQHRQRKQRLRQGGCRL